MKDKYNIIIIFFAVIISRLPFLWNSPGIDPDNWLVLETGKQIAETGVYRASRLPGYPVSEYLSAFFGTYAWLVLNFVSAFFTAFSCIVFYKILEEFRADSKLMTTLALGFIQSVFIASTNNMEYTWALFFLLTALWLLLKKKLIPAGLALGIMISIRFTNILFLIPILYFLYYVADVKSIKKYFIIYFFATLAFLFVHLPVLTTYSYHLFPDTGSETVSLKTIISQYTLHIYGFLGLCGVVLALVHLIVYNKSTIENFRKNSTLIIFSGLMIFTTTILYIRFPFESYYNLPLVPFVILIFSLLMKNAVIKKIVFVSFIISPFLFYLSANKFQIKGAIFVNEQMENDFLDYTKSINTHFSEIAKEKKLLIAGGFYNCYLYNFTTKNTRVKIYKRPTEELLNYYKSKNYSIFYPCSVKDEIKDFHNYDISKYGEQIMDPFSFDR